MWTLKSLNTLAVIMLYYFSKGSYINIVSVPDGKEGKRFGYASTAGSRAEKWKQESDLWVHGFW